jgi:hypothetical protein
LKIQLFLKKQQNFCVLVFGMETAETETETTEEGT